MREATVYKKGAKKSTTCLACQRYCQIPFNGTGYCQTRTNQNGKLYSLTYGIITGIQADPIEKKPFYHFYPGTLVASIGSWGCNFQCKQCLNSWCSWGHPGNEMIEELKNDPSPTTIDPKRLVEEVKKHHYLGIAFTYNEPSINPEFVHDVARLAKKGHLFTTFVTNGSWTREALRYYGRYIDAANIDFKGFSEKTYAKMGAVFREIPAVARLAKRKYGIHVEITTLLIPEVNDSPKELEKMASWVKTNLGADTPWHLTRYDPSAAPDENFQKIPPTSIGALEKAAEIGKKAGLRFVYVWAPGSDLPGGIYSMSNTVCPKCQSVVIRRTGWQPDLSGIDKKGRCFLCKTDLNITL